MATALSPIRYTVTFSSPRSFSKEGARLQQLIYQLYLNWDVTDKEVEMQSRKIAQLAAEIEKLRTLVSSSSGIVAGLTLGLATGASRKGLLLCGVGGAFIGAAAAKAFEYLRKGEKESRY